MSNFTVPNKTFIAGGNITPSSFVKITGDHSVVLAGAGEVCHGISFEGTMSATSSYAATSGYPVAVYQAGEECYLTAGGSVSAGNLIKSDSSGFGVAATTEEAGAVALEAGASGELFRVRVLQMRIDTT